MGPTDDGRRAWKNLPWWDEDPEIEAVFDLERQLTAVPRGCEGTQERDN